MEIRQYNKGDIIIKENDIGSSFFQMKTGSAAVVVSAGSSAETQLTILTPGQYFGEMAILEGYRRSASIIALEDNTTAYEIPGSDLDLYFKDHPENIIGIFKHLSERLRALTIDYDKASSVLQQAKASKEPKKDEGLFALIRKFAGTYLNDSKRNQISVESEQRLNGTSVRDGYSVDVVSYAPGTIIFKEGEPSDCLYAIHWGSVGIYTNYGTEDEKLLTTLSVNQFFGEMGVLEKAPRSATAVVLNEETTLEVLRPNDFYDLFIKNPAKLNMILMNLSYRLRRLTNDYIDVCNELRAFIAE